MDFFIRLKQAKSTLVVKICPLGIALVVYCFSKSSINI
jgi:hypothetical protein